jgi:hypothetical protein
MQLITPFRRTKVKASKDVLATDVPLCSQHWQYQLIITTHPAQHRTLMYVEGRHFQPLVSAEEFNPLLAPTIHPVPMMTPISASAASISRLQNARPSGHFGAHLLLPIKSFGGFPPFPQMVQ